MSGNFPILASGMVAAVQANPPLIFVRFPSTQGSAIPVRPSYEGYADDLRVHQTPLPRVGTTGLIAFPYGDSRNGIWLTSIYPGHTTAVYPDSDAHYRSDWSGDVHLQTGAGDVYRRFADGSYILASESTTPPDLTRNVVNADQAVEQIAYPDSDRRSGDVAPKAFRFRHASGTILDITPQGAVKVTFPSGDFYEIADGVSGAPDALVLASKLVAFFNDHTHPDKNTPPAQQMTAQDIASVMVGVSK